MSHALVWFCRVHLQKQPAEMFLKKVLLNPAEFTENTCALIFFLALLFFLVRYGEIWLRWIHQLTSVGPFSVKEIANNFTRKTKEHGKRHHYILLIFPVH